MGLFGVLFLCCDYYHFVGSRISENLLGLIGVNYDTIFAYLVDIARFAVDNNMCTLVIF